MRLIYRVPILRVARAILASVLHKNMEISSGIVNRFHMARCIRFRYRASHSLSRRTYQRCSCARLDVAILLLCTPRVKALTILLFAKVFRSYGTRSISNSHRVRREYCRASLEVSFQYVIQELRVCCGTSITYVHVLKSTPVHVHKSSIAVSHDDAMQPTC
jgi:hypothetical protein